MILPITLKLTLPTPYHPHHKLQQMRTSAISRLYLGCISANNLQQMRTATTLLRRARALEPSTGELYYLEAMAAMKRDQARYSRDIAEI